MAIQEKIARIAKLEGELKSNSNASNILRDFIDQGIAVQDEDGNVSIPSASKQKDHEESEISLTDKHVKEVDEKLNAYVMF